MTKLIVKHVQGYIRDAMVICNLYMYAYSFLRPRTEEEIRLGTSRRARLYK